MKRFITLLALLVTAAALIACASDSYTLVHYATLDRMENDLSFEMSEIPLTDELSVVAYAAQDGELGEITYKIEKNEKGDATLIFRKATPEYAKKLAEHNGTPGIAGIAASKAVKTERLGTADVTYYVTDTASFAVWEWGGYSYSAAVVFDSPTLPPEYTDVYTYVLSFIAS